MRFSTIVLILLMSSIAGCGSSGPQIAPVHGRITLDHQPLAKAEVVFQPDGSQRASVATTDADGRYVLLYKRGQAGAIVGHHSVSVRVSPEVVQDPPIIAARFNSNTQLSADVKPGDNEFSFNVTTEDQ
jgi:hypothetical protein